ncbi:MAG: Alcohol dehydrogenase zinc-binding domain protein [Mucilaginibacter sp.]|nr:Alcohol dehydrogenase zinc-binding domain protein [Mucilaginibacter sp.]
MKAILLKDFGSADNFIQKDDFPVPAPGNTDILINIKAAAFNPVDYQMRQGKTESKRMHSPILGREFSGIVVKAGKLVKKFKEGDAVFAASGSMGSNGTYAQYISIPENIAAKKPESITFEEAAAIPTAFVTALQCYNRLSLKETDSVFVSGAAGGVGLAFVKLLLAKRHKQIIVTAGNTESKQQLIQAGLSEQQIIDYKQEDLASKIISANKGNYFHHCIDMVGGKMAELSAEVLITNGTYADVTALTTEAARGKLFDKGAVIINISNYAYSSNGNKGYYGESLNEITRLLENNFITPPPVQIVGELSAETVKKAHLMLEDNLTKGRKLVMQII